MPQIQLPLAALQDLSPQFQAVVVVLLGTVFYQYLTRRREPKVPTLKISTKPWIWGAREDREAWVADALSVLQKGYETYSRHGKHYLVQRPEGKALIVAPQFVEEIRRAPDEYLDQHRANNEVSSAITTAISADFSKLMQMQHTISPKVAQTHWHSEVPIRKNLTESLGPRLPDIVDEAKFRMMQHIGNAEGNTLFHDTLIRC